MNFSDFIATIDALTKCLLEETALLKANRFTSMHEIAQRRDELSNRYLEQVDFVKANIEFRQSLSTEGRNLLQSKIETLSNVTSENQTWHARMSNIQNIIAGALADAITAEENKNAKRYSPLGLYTQSRAVRAQAIAVNSVY